MLPQLEPCSSTSKKQNRTAYRDPALSTSPDCCCWLHFCHLHIKCYFPEWSPVPKVAIGDNTLAGMAVASVGCLTIACHDLHCKVSAEERQPSCSGLFLPVNLSLLRPVVSLT